MLGSSRNDPVTHASMGDALVCGSRSMAALMRSQECRRCSSRLNDIGLLLLDAADGKDVSKQAAVLVAKLGIDRASE